MINILQVDFDLQANFVFLQLDKQVISILLGGITKLIQKGLKLCKLNIANVICCRQLFQI